MDRRPNCFLVGAPKCGTSAMRRYLAQHPEVFFAVPDEPGFFDADLRFLNRQEWLCRDLDEYLNLYRRARTWHRILAEGSVYILYSEQAIRRILSLSPDAKFLVMMRSPYEASISMHGENLKAPIVGREPCPNFEAAWDDLGRRASVDQISGVHPWKFRYDRLFSYAKPLQRLFEIAGKESVYVIIYEEFKDDNESVFGNLCRFLGLTMMTNFREQRINERSQARDNAIARTVGRIAAAARTVPAVRRFRGRGYTLNRFTQQKLEKPVVSDDLKRKMSDAFSDDVREVERIIGKRLPMWSCC